MALTTAESTLVTVLEDGQLQVLKVTRILEDGVEIAHTNHRHVVVPGQPLAVENQRVQDIGNLIHTQPVIDAYVTAKALLEQ